jgi:protein-arginine kinase activator protein McsA
VQPYPQTQPQPQPPNNSGCPPCTTSEEENKKKKKYGCAQGYFTETESGIKYTVWSRRKCGGASQQQGRYRQRKR